MDIGVGSGYYPAHAARELSKTKTLCLVDINPSTLEATEARLRKAGYSGQIEKLQHDVFKPLPECMRGRFDSISMFYLMHCLPGTYPDKASKIFTRLVPALARNGTLYGCVILGRGVRHNVLGRLLMWYYNSNGIFGNDEDSSDGLAEALNTDFEEVDLRLYGTVAVFAARRPK